MSPVTSRCGATATRRRRKKPIRSGKLPYLGHDFEYLEKRPGTAPWLRRSTLSTSRVLSAWGRSRHRSPGIGSVCRAWSAALQPVPRTSRRSCRASTPSTNPRSTNAATMYRRGSSKAGGGVTKFVVGGSRATGQLAWAPIVGPGFCGDGNKIADVQRHLVQPRTRTCSLVRVAGADARDNIMQDTS